MKAQQTLTIRLAGTAGLFSMQGKSREGNSGILQIPYFGVTTSTRVYDLYLNLRSSILNNDTPEMRPSPILLCGV